MSGRVLQRLRQHLRRSSPMEYFGFTLNHRIKRTLAFVDEMRANSRGTFPAPASTERWGPPLFGSFDFSVAEGERDNILADAQRFLNHQFNILGSGWRDWNLSKDLGGTGYSTRANQIRAMEIRRHLPADYLSLDWHTDIKSGFSWDATQWWRKVPIQPRAGVDIKIPWEMARFQHLPTMALAFGLTKNPQYAREGLHQILDFLSLNPPSYGVNWVSPMEVAIRAVNWIVFLDLIAAAGFKPEGEILGLTGANLLKSGEFILAHLEWHPYLRTNHFLANLTGLLFISERLKLAPVARGRFDVIGRFLAEIDYQFHSDGSGFEGSTCYHQLSMEMAVLGLGLLLGKGAQAAGLAGKISAMGEFSKAVIKPGGEILQIGDNDSGRLVKLPWTRASEQLHYDQVVGAWAELTGSSPVPAAGRLAAALVRSLSRGRKFEVIANPSAPPVIIRPAQPETPKMLRQYRFGWPEPVDLKSLKLSAFRDFGLYIVRSPEFFLSFRLGGFNKKGLGGHFHNDQLAIELQVRGRDVVVDPGSLTYTADPETRNRYRSVKAHFAPQIGREPARLDQGLFYLVDDSKAELTELSVMRLGGRHNAYGSWIYRMIEITAREVVVTDGFSGVEPLLDLQAIEPVGKCPGYGLAPESLKS